MRSSYHSVKRWLRNTSEPDASVHSSLLRARWPVMLGAHACGSPFCTAGLGCGRKAACETSDGGQASLGQCSVSRGPVMMSRTAWQSSDKAAWLHLQSEDGAAALCAFGSGVGPASAPAAEGVALDDHQVAVSEGRALVHVLLAPVPRLHLRARLRLALLAHAHLS